MTTVTAKVQVYVDRDQATLLERTLDAYKDGSNCYQVMCLEPLIYPNLV